MVTKMVCEIDHYLLVVTNTYCTFLTPNQFTKDYTKLMSNKTLHEFTTIAYEFTHSIKAMSFTNI